MYRPNEIESILVSEEEIREKVKEMGRVLTEEYKDKNPLFLCVLKGSVTFFSDLIRAVECPLEIDFIRASSYGSGTVSGGKVNFTVGGHVHIEGRDVVVVEDILDTARTLYTVKNEMLRSEPASLKIVTLLDKPSRRVVKGFSADYTGFAIEDHFVVGYGLDYNERFRNLPYVGILKPEVYT
ncbi:MAG: hypoxanthine phosphoribosyltransferase [Ruminococcaceae bacterium]|nr:hypoxanthine phosphoribosyltransferase [Oscillospiraceae bacterium]